MYVIEQALFKQKRHINIVLGKLKKMGKAQQRIMTP